MDCIFENNIALMQGGAISISNSLLTKILISNSIFKNSFAY